MFNILPRLESEFPWLHTRSGTDRDAFEFCERKGIHVGFGPDFPTGVWVMVGARHFFFVNSAVSGWLVSYVLFHEIGHYLFHAPTGSNVAVEFCDPHMRRKNHIEAEQVAALLLLPPAEIETVIELGAYNLFPELANLLSVRLAIAKDHGI